MQNAGKRKKWKKRKNLKTILLLCLIGFMCVNCEKETMPEFDAFENQFDVQEAKDWFESKYSETMPLPSKSVSFKSNGMPWRTNWKQAFSSTRGHETVVEVPLYHLGGLRIASESSQDKYRMTNNDDYLKPLFRLIVIHDRRENTNRSYVMKIVGTTTYLESKHFDLNNNTYHKKDHDFSGTVDFETLSGTFVNGWRLTDGSVTHKLRRIGATGKSTRSKKDVSDTEITTYTSSTDCTTFGYIHSSVMCRWYYQHATGEWIEIAGSCGTVDENIIITWEECGNGDGDNDYSGVDDPPVQEDKPCDGDPLPNMQIAPQTNSGIRGGTFGDTRKNRDGSPRKHEGIDLKNDYGAPIYAMFPGTARQENQYKNGKVSGAGHMVSITSVVGGETYVIKYFHMQDQSRISNNTEVMAGDIIGYQGDSGNLKNAIAEGLAVSHLHVKVKQNGRAINPQLIMGTKFNTSTGQVISNNCN